MEKKNKNKNSKTAKQQNSKTKQENKQNLTKRFISKAKYRL